MVGVFVQTNETGPRAARNLVGYVVEESGCWQWVGYTMPNGYGTVRSNGFRGLAHRWMYEREVGPIPSGMTIDHLCRNRGCVNPAHLEVVDIRTNILRGTALSAQRAKQTHCQNGHILSKENIRPGEIRRGRRRCATCQRARARVNRKRVAYSE